MSGLYRNGVNGDRSSHPSTWAGRRHPLDPPSNAHYAQSLLSGVDPARRQIANVGQGFANPSGGFPPPPTPHQNQSYTQPPFSSVGPINREVPSPGRFHPSIPPQIRLIYHEQPRHFSDGSSMYPLGSASLAAGGAVIPSLSPPLNNPTLETHAASPFLETSDESLIQKLDSYMDANSITLSASTGEEMSSAPRWVKDLEAILQESEETRVKESLCENRENANISAPFKLSLSTFHTLEQALASCEDGDASGSEKHSFCLTCLRAKESSTMAFNGATQETGYDYTPAGYEGLSEANDLGINQEAPLYLIEVNTNDGDDYAKHLRLYDFDFVSSPKNDSPMSLSVKIIPSSELIDILRTRATSYEAARQALIAAASKPLPVSVESGLVAVVTQDRDSFRFSSAENGNIVGFLVFRFGLLNVRLRGNAPDPFSGSVAYKQFFIGRLCSFIVAEHEEENPLGQEISSRSVLEKALLNANRFVPIQKKLQWDFLPHALISISPHPHLPENLTRWLLDPEWMRCRYDVCMANAILYLGPDVQSNRFIVTHFMGYGFEAVVDNVKRSLLSNKSQIASECRRMLAVDSLSLPKASAAAPFSIHNCNFKILQSMCKQIDEASTVEEAKKAKFCTNMRDCILGYLERILVAAEIERLRCMEDMKQHDLYSIRWQNVEIPQPSTPHPACRGCGCPGSNFDCAFHCALKDRASSKRPVVIRSKKDLENFPKWLRLLREEDRLVVRILVPGVADNFPLVSVGDLVRFRFADGVSTVEVVGEVIDVVVKTEVVSVAIPSPLLQGHFYQETLPYLQALLCTEKWVVEASTVLDQRSGIRLKTGQYEHCGRFDLRFGFLGGDGFRIARKALSSAIVLQQQWKGDRKMIQLHRLLAPSFFEVDDHPVKSHQLISDWVHPVNVAQTTAVFDIVHQTHGVAPYILYGPAGTGKTLTLCEAIVQLRRRNPKSKILLCAPSDSACDVLATRLLPLLDDERQGHVLMRVNWWSRKTESLPASLLRCTPMSQTGVFIIPSQDEIMAADVVVCQCFVAGCLDSDSVVPWMERHFTHVFVDESSQAMECEAFVPLLKVGNCCSIILAGDTRQLGPTIRDPDAAKLGLGISIQDRLMQLPLYRSGKYRVITTLVGNYRSHNALLSVPSNLFYNGSLQCLASDEVTQPYENWGDLGPARFPLLLCDVWKGKEQSKLDTPSFFNLEECVAVISIIQGLLESKRLGEKGSIDTREICVITPFRAQVLTLRAKLRLVGLGSINVGVVEDFQGQEFSIVLISTVLTQEHKRWSRGNDDSNEKTEGSKLGFMHDPRRFNVAITRAHALCIIVGHATYLKSSGSYWTALIEHIERNDGVVGPEGKPDNPNGDELEQVSSTDPYGVSKLVKRVEELNLGAAHEESKLDLSYYYDDMPQWKVMLA